MKSAMKLSTIDFAVLRGAQIGPAGYKPGQDRYERWLEKLSYKRLEQAYKKATRYLYLSWVVNGRSTSPNDANGCSTATRSARRIPSRIAATASSIQTKRKP